MAGASELTRRVQFVNMNWAAGADGSDGTFEFLIVTEDGQRHVLHPSTAAASVLLAVSQTNSLLLWDPEGKTLVAANLVGRWIADDWSASAEA